MKINNLIFILTAFIFCSACNDEWKEEQYKHYVSFKAPINDQGVTRIYIRYNSKGEVAYQLPLIVSGSTPNNKDMTVRVAVDSDTLNSLNLERFQSRTDLYYKELESHFFSIPESVKISAGEISSEMNINFTLKDIDLADKWLLPITILEDNSNNYIPNPRKNYKKALLRIMPFNDYSGYYSGTALKFYLKGYETESAIVKNDIPTYVVDENTIFFYAGMIGEDDFYRKNYKINVHFDRESNVVTFSPNDPKINFEANGTATYKVDEFMDEVRSYLLHRYITINNIDYTFTDYTTAPGNNISFTVRGSMIMERKINTQIPDEDQAIEW